MFVINVNDLHKSFGKYSILDGISLQVEPGTVYGLVGLNGAGKTTLLRLLLGILKPDKGSVSVIDFTPWNHNEAYYRKIGVVLEHDGFWGNLTMLENLKIYASAKGINYSEAEKYFREFWSNTPLYNNDKKVKYLSRGQRMQCALCRAFMGWPDVYFLDEPAIALDVAAYEHFKEMVRIAENRGATFIISSHQLDTIDILCTRAGNLRDKRLTDIDNSSVERSLWILAADDQPAWGEIIESVGGLLINNEHGCRRFEIADPDTAIPNLVAKLVANGCAIREIKKAATRGFSDTIKSMYGSDVNEKGEAR